MRIDPTLPSEEGSQLAEVIVAQTRTTQRVFAAFAAQSLALGSEELTEAAQELLNNIGRAMSAELGNLALIGIFAMLDVDEDAINSEPFVTALGMHLGELMSVSMDREINAMRAIGNYNPITEGDSNV